MLEKLNGRKVPVQTGVPTGARSSTRARPSVCASVAPLGITAIGGLTIGASYYVHALDGGLIKLYDTKQQADDGKATGLRNLTSAGVAGQKHLLLHGALAFLGEGEVVVTTGTIRLLDLDEDIGLHTGDAVAYDSGGGAVMGARDGAPPSSSAAGALSTALSST